MFIKIGGPNGSGKTTLTKELEIFGREIGLPIVRVKGGDILLRLAGVRTYEQLREIPEVRRAALRPDMYRIMYEEDLADTRTIRIRDAHFSLYDPETGKFTEAGAQQGDKNQMLMMVVLNPDSKVLLNRRLKDRDRQDRILDPNTIRKEIEHELRYARKEASELGVRLLELPNPDGFVRETTVKIIEEIQRQRVYKEGGRGYRSTER